MVKKHKIKSYFLLDVEFPYIFKTLDEKLNKNIAVRFSEYETIDLSRKLINKVNWIWLDTYKKFPIDIIIPVFNEGSAIIEVIELLEKKVKTKFRILICYDDESDKYNNKK